MTPDRDDAHPEEADATREAPDNQTKQAKRTWRAPAQRLEEIEIEIARVRAREEKRLIAAADKAGFFRHRFDAAATLDMFTVAIGALTPRKRSALAKLEQDAARQRSRLARAARADDARRKALLGGFLVAQCRHKPEFHAAIATDIRAFLKGHPNETVATRNLALLEAFLADPANSGTGPDHADQENPAPKSEHNDRAHRLILLGAWVLDRQTTRAELALLISEELEGFLDQDTQAERHKQLLGNLLP